jgi:hypothetical protein
MRERLCVERRLSSDRISQYRTTRLTATLVSDSGNVKPVLQFWRTESNGSARTSFARASLG